MIGQRVGAYEIDALIGAGGMGEVYRARDAKLGRHVAIKILPKVFAADAERLQRFEREARLLAALNHANIATIYGIEDAAGTPAIVMELIEGETLADRVAVRPSGLPPKLVIDVARQLAEALDAAHQKGIVHRDLKPANIKLTPEGVVKVLDFGLSKLDPVSSFGAGTDTPPSTAATVAGHVFGTAAYMSPEQARGQAVDKRTDIWAFGCVLFELLSGHTAFAGPTGTDILAAVLDREPDWSALPPTTPPQLRRLVRRCLEKDTRRRFRDIGDVAAELEEAPTQLGPKRSRAALVGAAVALFVAVVVGLTVLLPSAGDGSATASADVVRTTLVLPDNQRLSTTSSDYPLALSPDGTKLAYVAERNGRSQLYLRALSSLESTAMPGTTDARHPFFSADGKWIGFFADGALQKVSTSGGAPLRIVRVPELSMGASWGADGTIVYAVRGNDLMRVSSNGGVASPLVGSSPAAWPEILADGKTVMFATGMRGETSAIATMPIEGGVKRIIARTTDSGLQGPANLGAGLGIAQPRLLLKQGFLVYGVSANPGALRAIRIDPASLETLGPALPLVESIERGSNGGGAYYALSHNGLLIYASTRDLHELVWVDRHGAVTPITTDRAAFRLPALSPDGSRVAVAINDETRRSDIWVYDVERGTKRRLTSDDHNLEPVWTPDGRSVAFSDGGISEVSADGGGPRTILVSPDVARRILPAGTFPYPTSWSPDGRDLMFQSDGVGLWIWARGTDAPRPLLDRPFDDYQGRFSPDGRWLAYGSNESGRAEVYVVPYPALSGPIAVSTEGGSAPRWSRDGKELFYRNGDALMVASIGTDEPLRFDKPQLLFTGDFSGAGRARIFDVAPDGQRFVMIKSDEASTLGQLTVVQNWFDELAQ